MLTRWRTKTEAPLLRWMSKVELQPASLGFLSTLFSKLVKFWSISLNSSKYKSTVSTTGCEGISESIDAILTFFDSFLFHQHRVCFWHFQPAVFSYVQDVCIVCVKDGKCESGGGGRNNKDNYFFFFSLNLAPVVVTGNPESKLSSWEYCFRNAENLERLLLPNFLSNFSWNKVLAGGSWNRMMKKASENTEKGLKCLAFPTLASSRALLSTTCFWAVKVLLQRNWPGLKVKHSHQPWPSPWIWSCRWGRTFVWRSHANVLWQSQPCPVFSSAPRSKLVVFHCQ